MAVERGSRPVEYSSAERLQLQQRVQSSLTKLRLFIDQLGWTEQSLLADAGKRTCSVDGNHVVNLSKYKRHVRQCQYRRMGYSKEDLKEMTESSRNFYTDSSNVVRVKFDQKLQDMVIRSHRSRQARVLGQRPVAPLPQLPLTARREALDVIASDRAALYDYVVKLAEEERTRRNLSEGNFPPPKLLSPITGCIPPLSGQLGEASAPDMCTRTKNFRARRAQSSVKKVPKSRKTYTEMVREIIGSQMESLTGGRQY